MTSSILSFVTPESFKQDSQGLIVLLIKESTKPSNLDLVRVMLQCLGPEASAVK